MGGGTRLFCISSNKFSHLVPGWCFLARRYWPESDRVVLFETLEPETEELCGATAEGVGPLPRYDWTGPIREYFSSVPDEYVILMLEDFWITGRADHWKIDALTEVMRRAGVSKMCLNDSVARLRHEPFGEMIAVRQDSAYRCSLHAYIWKREYLLKKLSGPRSIWEFDAQNSKHDGALILGYADSPPLDYVNLMVKGKPNWKEIRRLPVSDVTEMIGMGIAPSDLMRCNDEANQAI